MLLSRGQLANASPQVLAEAGSHFVAGTVYSASAMTLATRTVSYGALYRAQPNVSALVDKIANAAAHLSITVWVTDDDGQRTVDTTSAYARLMADPCPGLSPYAFWRWWYSTYEVYGEVFGLKVRGKDGTIIAVLPMHPTKVAVKRDDKGKVQYVFTTGIGDTILTLPAEDVVAQTRWNPDSLLRGVSRLEPLRSTLSNEDAARRANENFWRRGARPSVIIRHPSEISPEAAARVKAGFDARYTGAENFGGSVVVDEGMEVEVVQLSAEDLQYIESRKLNREECCMVFDVPPPVVHILDHATFSNITEQMRSMYRDTMSPRLRDTESTFNTFLRPEFDPDGALSAAYDLASVLRGDFEQRATSATSMVTNGVMTPNEAREFLDLGRMDDPIADRLFANQATQPLGTPIVGSQPATTLALEPAPATEAVNAPASKGAVISRRAAGIRGTIQKAATREDMTAESIKAMVKAIRALIEEQAASILAKAEEFDLDEDSTDAEIIAALLFDPEEWDEPLAEAMDEPSVAIVSAVGIATATSLGGEFKDSLVKNWLQTNVTESAKAVNAATKQTITVQIKAALEDADDPASALMDRVSAYTDEMKANRVEEIAQNRVTVLQNFAEQEAAQQTGQRWKEWQTPHPRPRASHARMHGVRIPVDETFPNGMRFPGDPSAPVEEIAGCTCYLDFGKDDEE